MLRINILYATNGLGKDRDVELLRSLFESLDCTVTINGPSQNRKKGDPESNLSARRMVRLRYQKLVSALADTPPFDVNLFIERVWPEWCKLAKINCLIPNQEWFPQKDIPILKKIDLILCKSRLAESIFKNYGETRFISFTSQDRFNQNYSKDYNRILHIAGGSLQKGTHRIINAWEKHPEWPTLTILQHSRRNENITAANINCIKKFIDDKNLIELQNMCGVHLCPSRSEGFGHYINEALGCKSVVLTTDAPPMNELVESERGVLVDSIITDTNHMNNLGLNYYFDPKDFERKINYILGLTSEQRTEYGRQAREWFTKNDLQFRENVTSLVTHWHNGRLM